MSWCGSLLFQLGCLNVYIHVIPQIWGVSAFISAIIPSAPLFLSSRLGTLVHILVHLTVSHKSLSLCLLFFSLFSFCSSDLTPSFVLSPSLLILSSASSNLPLNLLVDFSFKLLAFLAPEFFVCLFYFRFSSSLFIFPFLLTYCILGLLHIFF